MACINCPIKKQVKITNESLLNMLNIMYEMALMLIKFESNEKLFEFIEEYQKNFIEKGA